MTINPQFFSLEPRILYRYYGNSEYWLDVLRNKRVYTPRKSELNDVHEMKLQLLGQRPSRNVVKKLLVDSLMEKGYSRNQAIEQYRRERDSGRIDRFFYKERLQKSMDSVFEMTLGIVCFSETFDHPLMWTHYASSHAGICLGFERNEKNRGLLSNARKVIYSNDIPIVNLSRPAGQLFSASEAVLHKGLDWEYEKEWRIPTEIDKYKYVRFRSEELKVVYLGNRLLDDMRRDIFDALKENFPTTEIYDIVANKNDYGFHTLRLK
jgi:hypothetical protein